MVFRNNGGPLWANILAVVAANVMLEIRMFANSVESSCWCSKLKILHVLEVSATLLRFAVLPRTSLATYSQRDVSSVAVKPRLQSPISKGQNSFKKGSLTSTS